ncbi:hypothetical protein SPRG_12297 [Saprolegnia parasitica CBS 223.65]|uniref:Uncharacterized protein n=1 Tax=Saprolegnia parasitica (strain CBS 223.65) TaxID=695850 RepID=A0A067BVE4_SAPPC|nr:hypothetical protein SPRG_12297 [Saprolegnia parasitica CBS 223.65]KDO22213.1 hypothetical protein SPRG_12297 [Saprolegnia parasitica CBS 223.65]|eukprot:XP_012207054.1 hypothetical protein SPRG_12297 [Saprolegnia parasitica CBS 223.65]
MVQLLKFLQKRKQQYFMPAYTDASTFTLPTEEEAAKADDAAPEVTTKPAPKKKGGKKAPAKKSTKATSKAKKTEAHEVDETTNAATDGPTDGEKPTGDAVESSESADAAEKVGETTETVGETTEKVDKTTEESAKEIAATTEDPSTPIA